MFSGIFIMPLQAPIHQAVGVGEPVLMPVVTEIEVGSEGLILPVYPFGHGNGESPDATLVFELVAMERSDDK